MAKFARAALVALLLAATGRGAEVIENKPVAIIFDTDMGNDIDDALALGMLHALADRGECRLLAVTLTKDHADAAPFCDLINAFYGRPEIPVGAIRRGPTPEPSNYLSGTLSARDGDKPRYPRRLKSGADAEDSVALLRRVLAAADDRSVVIIQVGFSTNLARLLDTPGDRVSPLAGKELAAKKCQRLVVMAGMFSPDRVKEYNVHIDLDSARKVFAEWPTELLASGFEIGRAVKFPARSIERDFAYAPHHPVVEAYRLYQKMPYDRETWDLTAALQAIRPDDGYFEMSPPGEITVGADAVTRFTPTPMGRRRYFTLPASNVGRVREALVLLASQPPRHCRKPPGQ